MSILAPVWIRDRTAQSPLVLFLLASVVAAATILAPAYLLIRVADAGDATWDVLMASATWEAMLRTALLSAAVTAGCIALGLPLAWLTVRTDLPLRGMWAVLLVLPLVVPSYVGAFIFVAALGPRGMLQDLLEPLGVETLPEIYGFKGAWLALTLFSYPYVLLPVRAALKGLDPAQEEAAKGLGQGAFATFLRVSLPQLRPALAAGGILAALYTLSDFGAVSILRFDSLTRIIYIHYTSAFDRTSAATLGLLLVVLALVIVSLEGVSRGRSLYYSRGQLRKSRQVALGVWRWPAFAFCLLVVGAGVGLPVSVVLFWLVRGVMAGETLFFVREATVNSVYASGLAAVVAVCASIPVAMLSVRHAGPLSSLLERISYSGFALPAISIALALVFFAANYTPFVYQTLSLLIFAYVIRFLPQALGACRTSLLQVNPRVEEAARGLGFGPAQVFARITVPQIFPGLSAGAILVFLTAIKELPATLLLSPIGFDTLATEIWSASTEGFFARAALPSLILLAVSGIPMALLVLREREVR